MNDEERCGTYETNPVTEVCVGRESVQPFDDGSEPLEQFGIALPEFIKHPGLFLEYFKERFGVATAIDPVGEWVVSEILPSFLGVFR
jgi:hypothetical protein